MALGAPQLNLEGRFRRMILFPSAPSLLNPYRLDQHDGVSSFYLYKLLEELGEMKPNFIFYQEEHFLSPVIKRAFTEDDLKIREQAELETGLRELAPENWVNVLACYNKEKIEGFLKKLFFPSFIASQYFTDYVEGDFYSLVRNSRSYELELSSSLSSILSTGRTITASPEHKVHADRK